MCSQDRDVWPITASNVFADCDVWPINCVKCSQTAMYGPSIALSNVFADRLRCMLHQLRFNVFADCDGVFINCVKCVFRRLRCMAHQLRQMCSQTAIKRVINCVKCVRRLRYPSIQAKCVRMTAMYGPSIASDVSRPACMLAHQLRQMCSQTARMAHHQVKCVRRLRCMAHQLRQMCSS
jgi:hypothetical protein